MDPKAGTPRHATTIIVIVVLGIFLLYLYFGGTMGPPPTPLPEKCTLDANLYCTSRPGLQKDSISFSVSNNFGADIILGRFLVKEISESPLHTCWTTHENIVLQLGEEIEIVADNCPIQNVEEGLRYKYSVEYTYQFGDDGPEQTGEGELFGRVIE